MGDITPWEIVLRLLLSALLAGLIGIERESHRRPAGLRTHILVSLGSCLIMLISIYGCRIGNRDPFRLAAQVVSGIGFLGAGTILHEGPTIRGLTTAASLWVVAGVGLAMGCGLYFPAIIGVLLVVLTLISLEDFEKKWLSSKTIRLGLILDINTNPDWYKISSSLGIELRHIKANIDYQEKLASFDLVIDSNNLSEEQILADLSKIDGIKKLIWK
jgi:putative Mg2+ transporter-C (MgtC) family protein